MSIKLRGKIKKNRFSSLYEETMIKFLKEGCYVF